LFAKLLVAILVLLTFPIPVRAGTIFYRDRNTIKEMSLSQDFVYLTFDDGPTEYTNQILDILKEKNVKATFFLIGENVIVNPSIAERILSEGHEIGNHTYGHGNLSQGSVSYSNIDINLGRFAIESQLDRSARLFRPPFLSADTNIEENKKQIIEITKDGYIIVGTDIDSLDWQRNGVENIVSAATNKDYSGIILFHDGGGDRSMTVAALPLVIDHYRQKGIEFRTVGEGIGLQKDQSMPIMAGNEAIISSLFGKILYSGYIVVSIVGYFTLIFTLAAMFKIVFLLLTSLLHFVGLRRSKKKETNIPSSVIIPAYNEEKVIESSIRSVLNSDHKDFEVILVDDGSKDRTFEIANSIKDPRLKVYRKNNGGKADTLNYGIKCARFEVIVTVDADTIFLRESLRLVTRHFEDSRISAVSGNVKLANRKSNLLTQIQALEYLMGFNLEKRMGDLLGCITIVPGAIGAFRKSMITQAGGLSTDTLAEDTDLTMSIQELGGKIIYDPLAISFTEAPSTMRAFLKQRFRWSFGILQAIWKHKSSILNIRKGSFGMIGLPYMIIYHLLFAMIGPLFDLSLIYLMITGDFVLVLEYLIIYLCAEALLALLALSYEKENPSQVWLLFLQRIIYRPIIYFVLFRSLYFALKGELVFWGNINREGKHLFEIFRTTTSKRVAGKKVV